MEALPKRKQTRLPDYDYSSAGAYFVTFCTQEKRCFLSEILVGAIHESPLHTEGDCKRALLGKAIGFLKMNSSKQIHQLFPELSVWQRSFYEHIIRNENDYLEIWSYIENNPLKWAQDRFYE